MSKYKELVDLLREIGVLQDDSEWAIQVHELVKRHRQKAAPAEDVRAVVDEPVSYGPYSVRWIGPSVWAGISEELPPELEGKQVYISVHPQRPVVMPEREMYCRYLRGVIPENRAEVEAHKDGWNACLNEIARLNP